MNDDFANMADVHRVIGDLPAGADVQTTTDGRDKSVAASRRRLARMVGRDAHELDDAAWLGLAQWFAETQMREIADATMQVLSDRRLSGDAPIVAAGVGCEVLSELSQAWSGGISISATSSTPLRRRARPRAFRPRRRARGPRLVGGVSRLFVESDVAPTASRSRSRARGVVFEHDRSRQSAGSRPAAQ